LGFKKLQKPGYRWCTAQLVPHWRALTVHAYYAYNACMKKNAVKNNQPKGSQKKSTQFTVRNVPLHVARAIRNKARHARQSLNSALVEALARQAGAQDAGETTFDDLDYLAGKWEDDPEFDAALADQDKVDEQLWK
jgi:hypothetical protein